MSSQLTKGPAANKVFASGGVDVRFESVVLFSYFITWESTKVLTPRPTANTGRWAQAKNVSADS